MGQTALSDERGKASSSEQALKESKSRIDALMTRVTELESSNLTLNQKMSDLTQNLMDTKIGLDMEIAVFRRLLESEEDRLGISIDGADDSFDGEVVAHSSPEIVRTVTTNSESNFQRKITVSQTQL